MGRADKAACVPGTNDDHEVVLDTGEAVANVEEVAVSGEEVVVSDDNEYVVNAESRTVSALVLCASLELPALCAFAPLGVG